MAYVIGAALGSLVVTYLLSRLGLWAFKRFGDTPHRVVLARGSAFAVAVFLGGLGFANGGPPRFGYAAAIYALPTLLWASFELLAMRGRAARMRRSGQ